MIVPTSACVGESKRPATSERANYRCAGSMKDDKKERRKSVSN
jgi:hypothetical protein